MKIAHDIQVWRDGGFVCSCGVQARKKYGYAKSWAYEAIGHVPDKGDADFRVRTVKAEPK